MFSSPFRGPVLAQTGGFVQCFFHHFRATWQRGWGVVGRQLYVGGDADALQRSPGSFDNLYKNFLRNSAPFPLLCCIFVDVLPPFAWSARPVVPQRGPRCRTMVAPLLFNCAPVVVQWRPRCGAIGVPLRCFLFSFLSVLADCFVETAENQSFGETRPKLKNSGQNKVCSPSSESQRRSRQFFSTVPAPFLGLCFCTPKAQNDGFLHIFSQKNSRVERFFVFLHSESMFGVSIA